MSIGSDRRSAPAARPVNPDVPGPVGPRPGWRRLLAYSIRIRRVEYLPVELAIYSIPALLFVQSGGDLLSGTYLLVFLTALSGMHFIDMINALADRDLDAVYKTQLSQAVYGLGVRNVRWQIGITGVVVAGLATYLAAATGHWDILPLVAVTLYLGAQYSVPPLHLKGAGAWQIPTLILILLWLPMLLIVRALPGTLDWPILAAIAGFGICQTGIVLVNTAEDWPEDAAFGIRTSVRAIGLTRSMATAVAMIGIGGGTALVAVFAIGGLTIGLALMAAAVVFALVHVSGTWRAVRGRSLDDALRNLRPRAKLVPLQVAATGWTTVIAAAFVLAGR